MPKIEKNVPMEPRCRYPFGDMKIGDSFFIERDNLPKSGRSALQTYSHLYGKRNKMRFAIRAQDDGFRCWRTE